MQMNVSGGWQGALALTPTPLPEGRGAFSGPLPSGEGGPHGPGEGARDPRRGLMT